MSIKSIVVLGRMRAKEMLADKLLEKQRNYAMVYISSLDNQIIERMLEEDEIFKNYLIEGD